MPTRVPVVVADDEFRYHIIAASLYPSLGAGSDQKSAESGKAWLVSIVDITNAADKSQVRVGGNADDFILVDNKQKEKEDSQAEDIGKQQFNVEKLGTILGTTFSAGETKTAIFVFEVPTGNHRYEESFQQSTNRVNLAIYLHDQQMTPETFRGALAAATATAGAVATQTAGSAAFATAEQAATAGALATARADATSAANAPLAVQHLGAGNTLLQAGNLSGAANEYATAEALSPSRADVQSAVATVRALTAKATAEAKSKAIQDHLGAAHSFEQAGNYVAALKEYDAVLALDAQNSAASSGRAAAAATATAVVQAAGATATAQAEVQAAAATAQAQAKATAGVQALVSNPPPGSYVGSDNGVAVVASDFRYTKAYGFHQTAPGSRYIACGVAVGGRDSISVNPLYFTLVLADGTSYSVDSGMFDYWSDPLQSTEVPAGGHAEGGILFLVKDGVAPVELVYKPVQLLNSTEVVVDLTRPKQ